MSILYENFLNITWQHVVMWLIGGLLIFLAIKKDMEPTLLLPLVWHHSCQHSVVGRHYADRGRSGRGAGSAQHPV